MIIGKWNKSVILTYLGITLSIAGMYLAFNKKMNYAFACLVWAGVCDLFDGVVARKMKRTDEEKSFGIELDSLADVINFIAFPVTILLVMSYSGINLAIAVLFAICGVARLAYFNMQAKQSEEKISYYHGLPVTYTALILPIVYLLYYLLTDFVFIQIFTKSYLLIAFFQIYDIPIPKPRGVMYIVFSVLAIVMTILYLVIL